MKKIAYIVLVGVLCLTACGRTEEPAGAPKTETAVDTQKPQAGIERSSARAFLEKYLHTHNCEAVYWLEEDRLVCVIQQGEKYGLSVLNLKQGQEEATFQEPYFDANTTIEKIGKYMVICQGKSGFQTPEKLQAMVVDENMQITDRIVVSEKMARHAFVILPKSKKIIYADTYGAEWKLCLKQCDYKGKKEKQWKQFPDVTKVSDMTSLKISKSERNVYFTGMYSQNQERSGELSNCIGKVTADGKTDVVCQIEKSDIYIKGEEAYFYDNCAEKTDGSVYKMHKDGTLTKMQIADRMDGKMGFSADGSLIWTLSQNRGEGQEAVYTISVYRTKDGERIYRNSNTPISWGVLLFPTENQLLGFYYGEQALETKWLQFQK